MLGHGICYPFIKACVFGSETKSGLLDEVSNAPRVEVDSGSPVRQMVKLIFCAVGLQVSFVFVFFTTRTVLYAHASTYILLRGP